MSRLTIVLRLALAVWCAVLGQAADTARVREDLDRYMDRVADRGFSGALLVARDGKVILSKGYGSLGPKGGRVVPTSAFDIASVTKQFTAAAVLKLEMQGRLNTSDRIAKYLADVPKDKEGITVHHLLTHTSGLPDNLGGDYEVVTREEMIKRILMAPLDSVPGDRYSYSNAGYSLLAALVELRSGQSWEEYSQTNLFRPARMRYTGYRLPRWRRDRTAVSFRSVRYPSPLDRPGPYWNLLGNGGVLSTIEDLYRWHRSLTGIHVLSNLAKAKLFTPYVREAPGGSTSYAYGWVVQKTARGTTLAWHNGGADEGFTSYVGRYLDDNVVIIMLSNSILGGGVQPIAFAPSTLEQIVFGGTYAVPPARTSHSKEDLWKYEATYRLPSGGTLLVSAVDRDLKIESIGRDAVGILTYPLAERSASSPLADRVRGAFDSLNQGDFAPLENIVGPEAAPDHTKRFRSFWADWQSRLGSYEGTQVLFGTPTGSRMSTYFELKFKNGTQVIRGLHREGGTVTLSRASLSSRSTFTALPVGADEFSYFDFRSGKNIRVQFSTKDGAVSGMVVRLPSEEIRIPVAAR